MATVTITLTDGDPTPELVGVQVDFGEAGADSESPAHRLALAMVRSAVGSLEDDGEEVCGHG